MTRISTLDVDIPDGWEDHSLYSFVAPAADISPGMTVKQSPFRRNVVLQQRPVGDDTTIDDCVDQVRATTLRDLGDLQITIEDGPPSSSFPTKRLTYKLVDDVTNTPVAQVIYVGLVARMEWQIAFSAPAIDLAGSLPQFDGMVASIRPVKAP